GRVLRVAAAVARELLLCAARPDPGRGGHLRRLPPTVGNALREARTARPCGGRPDGEGLLAERAAARALARAERSGRRPVRHGRGARVPPPEHVNAVARPAAHRDAPCRAGVLQEAAPTGVAARGPVARPGLPRARYAPAGRTPGPLWPAPPCSCRLRCGSATLLSHPVRRHYRSAVSPLTGL